MCRRLGAGPIAAMLLLGSFMALTLLFGGRASTAAAAPDQTSAPASTAPASTSPPTVPATTPRSTATTRPVASSRTRVTAPARVVPAVPNTAARPQYQTPTSLTPTTPAPPAPTTTIVGIGGRLPAAPVTLPLYTKSSNGHVDPAFAWLSGAGFAIVLLMVAYRLYATRPGGKDRAPLL